MAEFGTRNGNALAPFSFLRMGTQFHQAHSLQSNSACMSTVFTASSCKSGG
jgi:hypothetical protein